MKDAFERFGKVKDVYLPLEHGTRKPKGFGFVEFWNVDDGNEAIAKLVRSSSSGREVGGGFDKEDLTKILLVRPSCGPHHQRG